LVRHLLRLGIHHLTPLADGRLLVIVRKRGYLVDASGKSRLVFHIERGSKPANKGVCVTPRGNIFIADYPVNPARNLPVTIHRSRDGGESFETVYEFKSGQIAHCHFVQWDHYESCLWMGTGDTDKECMLFKSTDNGDSWKQIGSGSQLWRAVGLAFRVEALYWGTDAGGQSVGNHPNYVMRFDRNTGTLDKLLEVQGPCHGNATLRDGTLLISTGVEGGCNEKDRYVHLWASRDAKVWQELIQFKKDPWPYRLQFGVIRFPTGLENCNDPLFTCMGLAGAGEAAFISKIVYD
jgi:hypothetical protein